MSTGRLFSLLPWRANGRNKVGVWAQFTCTIVKVDGDRHSQVRWRAVRGHDFHQDWWEWLAHLLSRWYTLQGTITYPTKTWKLENHRLKSTFLRGYGTVPRWYKIWSSQPPWKSVEDLNFSVFIFLQLRCLRMVFQLQTRRAIYNCKAKAHGNQLKHKKDTPVKLLNAIPVDIHIYIAYTCPDLFQDSTCL